MHNNMYDAQEDKASITLGGVQEMERALRSWSIGGASVFAFRQRQLCSDLPLPRHLASHNALRLPNAGTTNALRHVRPVEPVALIRVVKLGLCTGSAAAARIHIRAVRGLVHLTESQH